MTHSTVMSLEEAKQQFASHRQNRASAKAFNVSKAPKRWLIKATNEMKFPCETELRNESNILITVLRASFRQEHVIQEIKRKKSN